MTPTSASNKVQNNPLVQIPALLALAGVVIGLNKVSVWIAPGILLVSIIGLTVVAIIHQRDIKWQKGPVSSFNHAHLATAGSNKAQDNPLALIPIFLAVAGAVIGLNKVSVWIAPGILLVSIVGLAVVGIVHRRAIKREKGLASSVDHARLASTGVAAFIPWLKDNIRGHEAVIDAIASDLELNLRLSRPGRPLGTFLLVGPTGTGKTFLAQMMGQALFKQSEFLALRMNQYKHADDVFTLIGPPPGMPGYEVGGALTRPVLNNPYRVVLLDELEKCHKDIHHCLYDILDTASCREKSSGRMVDFSGCVFFATCNSGVEALRKIREQSNDPAAWLGRSRDALVDAGAFDKAFLARWNGIYFMDELSPIHVAEVACMQLGKYWREYGLEVAYASPQIILDAVVRNQEFHEYGVRQLGAYIESATNSAIVEARSCGVKKVRLEVAENGRLSVTACE
jgi:heme exporter protein D